MKDSGLLKIALLWSLVGIFILLIVAVYTEPPELTISELGQHMGENIVVRGFVESASYKETVSFIELSDESGEIQVVIFEELEQKVYNKDQITVRGRVSEYKGELEVIAEEIACLRCS